MIPKDLCAFSPPASDWTNLFNKAFAFDSISHVLSADL